MSEQQLIEIWPLDTGITDLPPDTSELVIPEISRIRVLWNARRVDLGDSNRLRVFTEQLNREWAIETGIIENLYDIERGVTQSLIERGFQAAILEHGSVNRDPAYVLALIEDQKAALENLFAFVRQDRQLSTGYIKELHAMMTQSQLVTEAFMLSGERIEVPLLRGEWKKEPNYPFKGGTQYLYCPPEQTASEMDRLVEMHGRHLSADVSPEVEAAWLHHRFTQIHPFQDGNGRVARALASLALIRAGLFPLIVPRDEKLIYIESLERADQGNLRSLVLMVSRRQEIAYQRAINVIDKLAPSARTLSDSAAMLGEVFAKRPDVINTRLEERLSNLHRWLEPELTEKAAEATSLLRSAAGTGTDAIADRRLGVVTEAIGDEHFDASRLVLMNRWEVIPSRPQKAWIVRVFIGEFFDLVVEAYALSPEVNFDVQVAALMVTPHGLQALEIETLTLMGSESNVEAKQRVKKWVQEFLNVGLTAIRLQSWLP